MPRRGPSAAPGTAHEQSLRRRNPEARHAGGVYYTPRYIVDAIVERTLGPLLQDATTDDALSLRVLDPACGSGAFLLGVYDHLLNWHLRRDGVRLSLQKKRDILVHCIHGVDLDARAVEIAKTSLHAKLIEGEADEALPDLSRNLLCGNALLGEHGDFDAVVGNPPYVRVQALTEFAPIEVDLYKARYKSAAEGNYDIYVAFIERSLSLLRPGGRLGFIVPTKWWQASYGAPLRRLLLDGKHFAEVFDFADEQVFEDPTTYTCISIFTKDRAPSLSYHRTSPAAVRARGLDQAPSLWEHAVAWSDLGDAPWYPGVKGALRPLFDRLRRQGPFLNDETICPRVFQGLKTGLDSAYVLDLVRRDGDRVECFSKATSANVILESALLHPLVKGREMKRFAALPPERLILFPYETKDDATSLIPATRLAKHYPETWDYLRRNKEALEARERGRWQGPAWYQYSRNQALDVVSRPKLLTADMADRNAFSFDGDGHLHLLGGAAGGYGLLPARPGLASPLLALLNSTLLEWMLRPPGFSSPFRGGWYSCEARFINLLPIRLPSPADERSLSTLAERAVAAHRKLHAARSDRDRDLAARQIEAAEAEIDDRVFALYRVGDVERRAVIEAVAEARATREPDGAG